jgi:lambda repressor-like predicted transcriptional regulator
VQHHEHHPVIAELRRRGLSIADVARSLGYSPGSVQQAFYGYSRPWPKLRRRTASLLDMDEAALFNIEQVRS